MNSGKLYGHREIVHYDTSAMKRFLTRTLVKKTFFRTSIVRNFISRGVKMRIFAREACVKPHLRTRSDINTIFSTKIEVFSREHCSCYLFPDEMEPD